MDREAPAIRPETTEFIVITHIWKIAARIHRLCAVGRNRRHKKGSVPLPARPLAF